MQSLGHGMAVASMNTQQQWLPVRNLHNTELSDTPSWHHGGQGANKMTLSQKSTRHCRQLKFSFRRRGSRICHWCSPQHIASTHSHIENLIKCKKSEENTQMQDGDLKRKAFAGKRNRLKR